MGCTTLDDRDSNLLVPYDELTSAQYTNTIYIVFKSSVRPEYFYMYPVIYFTNNDTLLNIKSVDCESTLDYNKIISIEYSNTVTIKVTVELEFLSGTSGVLKYIIGSYSSTGSETNMEAVYEYLCGLSYSSSSTHDIDKVYNEISALCDYLLLADIESEGIDIPDTDTSDDTIITLSSGLTPGSTYLIYLSIS